VRERQARRRGAGAAICALKRRARGHGRHALSYELRTREHHAHAGHGQGIVDLHAHDARMRVGRAHEHQAAVARLAQVVGVAARAGEQCIVFEPAHGLAAAKALRGGVCAHGLSPRWVRA
jgi:hypothetical protein